HMSIVVYTENYSEIATFFKEINYGNMENFSDTYGLVGISADDIQIGSLNLVTQTALLNIIGQDSSYSIDLTDYVEASNYNIFPGLAYNKYNHSVYFMGIDSENNPSFYQVD